MYGETGKSTVVKASVTSLHLLALAIMTWILGWGGFSIFPAAWHLSAGPDNFTRRMILLLLAFLYLGKTSLTLYRVLARRMNWDEGLTIGIWINLIYLVYAVAGLSRPERSAQWVLSFGIFLFLAGSALNLSAEIARKRWKQKPQNKGKLYREGFFRYSRHINYFGENLSFFGFSLVAGRWWAFAIPALMALLFIFLNIPMLDAYLAKKYGKAFKDYAARTPRFVPFLY